MDIATIVILVFAGLAVLVALLVFIKAQKRKITDQNQKLIKSEWNKILNDCKKNPNTAIMEADKLLSYVLKLLGYEGSTGAMLKNSGSLFSNLDDVWEAHKMRNKIAHEMGIKMSYEAGLKVLNKFKRALRDLGVKF